MITDNPTLTAEEINLINIEIAKLCGFVNQPEKYNFCGDKGWCDHWRLFDNAGNIIKNGLPNYYSSLDACSEFERNIKLISLSERDCYLQILSRITQKSRMATLQWTNTTATAPQRCEAYLRLHGKWPVKGKV